MTITERLDTITAQLEKILSILGEEAKASEDSSQNDSLINGDKTANIVRLREWALGWGADRVTYYKEESLNVHRFIADIPLDHCPHIDFDSWDKELETGKNYSIEELCGEEE